MKKWEYKVKWYKNSIQYRDDLKRQGLNGWELVSVFIEDRILTYIFKREVIDG